MPRSRHIARQDFSSAEPADSTHIWLLRMLVPLGAHRMFVREKRVHDDELAIALGLDEWIETSPENFDAYALRCELRRRHARAERIRSLFRLPPTLKRNLARLGRFVTLSDVDRDILAFCVCIKTDRMLEETAQYLGNLSSAKAISALAVLTHRPEAAVRESLSAGGTLGRTGLVRLHRSDPFTLCSKLDLLTESIADHLMSSDDDDLSVLLREIARPAPAPLLSARHFDHIGESLGILHPYLGQSIESRRRGVNVFIHGQPGTGKTQLARVIARELGCELLEVSSKDQNGDPITGERRLRAYRFAQNFFSQRRALIVFDEAEDVFLDSSDLLRARSAAQSRKAWMNTTLEENLLPTLWLSNSVRCLDPAFVRRFDMIIEVPIPPKRQRENIIRETFGDLLAPAAVSRMAEHEALAPALIARAASVVESISPLSGTDASQAVEHVLEGILAAQGNRSLPKDDPAWASKFEPAFINADADLAAVAEGIAEVRAARLCLYGPPGTGKTAYAYWLAQCLGVPIYRRHASDLLSPFVGETEKNLARAFGKAERDRALLLLDEVDSFLQDRRSARATWEVTGINEMLTQMEQFRGVLVATTNLVADLDQAAMRRFDLKAKLDFLRPEQAWQLLVRHCIALGLEEPSDSVRTRVVALDCLTPGDFAAVVRQHRFRAARRPEDLVAALEDECRFKEGRGKRSVGFV